MKIREATPADLPGLVELWIEFMDFHADMRTRFVRSPDAAERWAAYIGPKLVEENVCALVAEDQGGLVGYLVGLVVEYPPIVVERRFGFVQEIAVTASRRREGIGRALYARAEAWFRARGLPHVEIRLDSDNALSRAFWTSQGYAPHTETLAKWF